MSDNSIVCEDCMSRVGEAKWRKRAVTAELELRRCYKDIEELTAECNDIQAQLGDAKIRNAVLEKRLEAACEHFSNMDSCPPDVAPPPMGCEAYLCRLCWADWLEQEVRV